MRVFFAPENIVPTKFGRFYKISTIRKKSFFESFLIVPPVFWFSWASGRIFFEEKNHAPRFDLSCYRKSFSPQKCSMYICEGKNSGHFWFLHFQDLPEGSIWGFWYYNNFYSTHQDLSTLKFSKIFAKPFSRNLGKGVSP